MTNPSLPSRLFPVYPIEFGGEALAQDLKIVLLAHEEDLARELVEAMMNHALGRTVGFLDMDDVDAVLAKLREVAMSPVFRRK